MRIVFKNQDGSIGILTPAEECLLSHGLYMIALKDVFFGIPFWIVEDYEIPSDRLFRPAWEIPEEWGPPSGYGSKYNTFEQVEEELLNGQN